MSFLEPAGFWLLLFVPLIVILYMLKLRREKMRVSSTLLWSRVCEDVQANAFWQRLRRNMLLLLQILVLILLTLAMARPYRPAGIVWGRDLIIVVDNSDSMRAKEEGGTRLEIARKKARALVEGLARHEEVTVVTAAPRPQVIVSRTEDRNRILAALDGIRPAGRADLSETLETVRELLAASPKRFAYILTDQDATTSEEAMQWIPCATSLDNLAITAADFRPGSGERPPQAMAALRNFSATGVNALVRVFLEETLIEAREESVAPDQRANALFDLPADAAGRLRIEIDRTDALEEDNAASLILSPERPVRVAFVGDEDGYARAALGLVPGTEIVAVTDSAPKPGTFDLAFWEHGGPGPELDGLHCVFDPAGSAWCEDTVRAEPKIVSWKKSDGPLASCNLGRLYIRQGRRVRPPPAGEIILRSSEGPLAAIREEPGRQIAVFGFSIEETDWPLLLSFPIFFNNLVEWTRAVNAESERSLAPGAALRMRIPASGRVAVTKPDGAKTEKDAAAGEFRFEETDQPGFYSVRAGNVERQYAVNILSEEESDLRRSGLAPAARAARTTGRTAVAEIGHWFLALACLALFVEWWVYHRRLFTV